MTALFLTLKYFIDNFLLKFKIQFKLYWPVLCNEFSILIDQVSRLKIKLMA